MRAIEKYSTTFARSSADDTLAGGQNGRASGLNASTAPAIYASQRASVVRQSRSNSMFDMSTAAAKMSTALAYFEHGPSSLPLTVLLLGQPPASVISLVAV